MKMEESGVKQTTDCVVIDPNGLFGLPVCVCGAVWCVCVYRDAATCDSVSVKFPSQALVI